MNTRSKILSSTHFIVALSFLLVSLYFLSSALTYDQRQSFVPPTVRYDTVENQYIVMNMKMPLLILFTSLFGLGWWCESYSEHLLRKDSRKIAIIVFYIPVTILIVSFIGMAHFPIGFINSAFVACGWIVVSGFYLRYTMITPEALSKIHGSK